MGVDDRPGVWPVPNATGPLTRLSGAPLHPEVTTAMAEAAPTCARIGNLRETAGCELVVVSGAEAGYVRRAPPRPVCGTSPSSSAPI